MPNIVKGSDMGGLLRYLAGPGRANEHTDPRVIAGDVVTMAVYAGAIDVPRATELAKLLDSPRQTVLRGEPVLVTNYRKAHALIAEGTDRKEAFDAATRDQNVWHCSLSLDPKDGQLDIDKWAMIARDFMREMGFTDPADGGPDARWTTVHHGLTKAGGDHVHIAMSVVRSDGTLADVRRDWPRSQEATRVLEHRYGLKVLASREERTTEQATRPDERGRAERVGAPETDREALRRRVRAAAVSAQDEAEFVRDLRAEGMVLRPRYAKGGTDSVVGYAVRMPAQKNRETGSWEKAIWYGGGQLSKDLTLSALRGWAGWDESEQAREAALTEWQRSGTTRSGRTIAPDRLAEAQSVSELSRWSQYMRTIPVEDRDAWAKAASQTAGVFAALSVRTETKPGPLDRLSRQLARAGQLPAHRRRPQNVHGSGLRHVARMLGASQSPAMGNLALMYALIECLLAIREMLEATDRARSAAAMASEARKALTEIHMRRDGIDPGKPYVRNTGSPAWAAAMRAGAVVDRVDLTEVEDEIRTAHDGWNGIRIAMAGRVNYDERGQIVDPSPKRRRMPTPSAKAQQRAAGPLKAPNAKDPSTYLPRPTPGAAKRAAEPYKHQPPPPHYGPDHDRNRGFER